jgi:hypothetical protein
MRLFLRTVLQQIIILDILSLFGFLSVSLYLAFIQYLTITLPLFFFLLSKLEGTVRVLFTH